MEVSSAQPNFVAGPSQITDLLSSKWPAQDDLAISAPKEDQSRKAMLEML